MIVGARRRHVPHAVHVMSVVMVIMQVGSFAPDCFGDFVVIDYASTATSSKLQLPPLPLHTLDPIALCKVVKGVMCLQART